MTLYELTGQFLQLLDMAEEGNLDQQTLNDTLEGLGLEIEDKADGYAKVIRQLEGYLLAIDGEVDRLSLKKKTIKNNIDVLKRNLEGAMIVTDKKKFKTPLFSFAIQKNAPSLDILDETKIPWEFYAEQEPKLDRKSLLAFVKENEVDYASVKQTESLRIR